MCMENLSVYVLCSRTNLQGMPDSWNDDIGVCKDD